MNNNLIDMDDLNDLLNQLNEMPDMSEPAPMTEEELASQRRYEEIIKKHKN